MDGRRTRLKQFRPGDRVVAIVNPSTRMQVNAVVQALEETCPPGVRLDIQLTQRSLATHELTDYLVSRANAVIAVGGDGTVSSVAAALTGTSIPLGIIPGGSTNIIAQELGIPADLNGAARLIFDKHDVRPLDVGVCNERYFLHMAGAGWDSQVFATTDRELKKRVGWLAYIPAAIKVLAEPARTFHFTVDDEKIDVQSPLVLICNGSSIITPSFRLGNSIRSDDGELDLVICTATRPHELANVFARFAGASLEDSPYIIARRAKTIKMASSTPVRVQLDGDVVDETPVQFSVLPREIEVIISPEAGRAYRYQSALAGV